MNCRLYCNFALIMHWSKASEPIISRVPKELVLLEISLVWEREREALHCLSADLFRFRLSQSATPILVRCDAGWADWSVYTLVSWVSRRHQISHQPWTASVSKCFLKCFWDFSISSSLCVFNCWIIELYTLYIWY